MDLFGDVRKKNLDRVAPLPARMRPRTLEEFAGQEHFLGPGKLLRRMLEADRLTSVIFYGPPGTGKTTLAQLVAEYTKSHFEQVNAASVGVKEVRAILDAAKDRLSNGGLRTVLFLDEIHRFNRSQQDILLPDVEAGYVILIGATTENPFFSVNAPLVSRSQIFQFAPLTEEEIRTLIRRAVADKERGFGNLAIEMDEEALNLWATMSDGDGRRALSALEVAVLSMVAEKPEAAKSGQTGSVPVFPGKAQILGTPVSERTREDPGQRRAREEPGSSRVRSDTGVTGKSGAQAIAPLRIAGGSDRGNQLAGSSIHITLDVAEQSIQRKAIVYDATGDAHYDAASALIKSMRGSDPDAAVYWVAKMLEAGEDPRFIARRIAILASEDIGNADPQALVISIAAYNIVERIGMPEAQLTLGQAAIYMATAPKSNASAKAIWAAMADVKEGRMIPVPRHLRDGHYAGAQRLGNGQDYKYAHDYPEGFVRQEYLGVDKRYYEPTDRGYEKVISQRMAALGEVANRSKTEVPGSSEGAGANPSGSAFKTRGADE